MTERLSPKTQDLNPDRENIRTGKISDIFAPETLIVAGWDGKQYLSSPHLPFSFKTHLTSPPAIQSSALSRYKRLWYFLDVASLKKMEER